MRLSDRLRRLESKRAHQEPSLTIAEIDAAERAFAEALDGIGVPDEWLAMPRQKALAEFRAIVMHSQPPYQRVFANAHPADFYV